MWPCGRALDCGTRGQGFDTYFCPVVSLSKDTFTHPKVLVIPRKRWLRPDMTEKLFTGTLSLNKTKANQNLSEEESPLSSLADIFIFKLKSVTFRK